MRGWAPTSSKIPVPEGAVISDDEDVMSVTGCRGEVCPAETMPGSMVVTETEGMGEVCTAVVATGCMGVTVTEGIAGV